jgi:nitrate reductase cytochrome c-type subunit
MSLNPMQEALEEEGYRTANIDYPSREHAIKTSHPSRQSCLQCHAPDADFDNRERIPNSPPPAAP